MAIRKLLLATLLAALTLISATLSTTTRPVAADGPCQVGTPSYNPALCAQVFGVPISPACQLGTVTYNQTLCAQQTAALGTSTTTSACAQGVSPQICLLLGSNTNQFCQVGSLSYNQ